MGRSSTTEQGDELMRDKSDEKQLLVGFLKLLQDHPDAGIIAGIVNRESADQVLRIDVNSLDISGYTLALHAGCDQGTNGLVQRASTSDDLARERGPKFRVFR